MCIIAACEDRKMTSQEIENCFKNNGDGAGVAYCTEDGKIHVEKGFMTLEEFQQYYETLDILPHVAHFRIATSGDVTPEMTHPYKIEMESRLVITGDIETPVLFHNGVIGDYNALYLNMLTSGMIDMLRGPINDTRVAAVMAAVFDEEILQSLSGKFVVMKPDGITTMWGDFENVNGVHFSNNGYKKIAYTPCVYGANNKNRNYNYNKNNKKQVTETKDNWDSDEWFQAYQDCPYQNSEAHACDYDCVECAIERAHMEGGKCNVD